MSLVNVVCSQVEVSASGWSPVQISLTERGVFECDCVTSLIRRPWLTGGCCFMEKKACSFWSSICWWTFHLCLGLPNMYFPGLMLKANRQWSSIFTVISLHFFRCWNMFSTMLDICNLSRKPVLFYSCSLVRLKCDLKNLLYAVSDHFIYIYIYIYIYSI